MTERGVQCGMDKRKVCVFLVLVGVGVACLLLMMYTLFYARPRTDQTIQQGPHSSLRLDLDTSVHS
jgi:hypothetical protein